MALTDLATYAKLKERKIASKYSENEISAYLAKTSILGTQVYWLVGADRKNMETLEVFNKNMPLLLSDKDTDWIFFIQGMKKSTRITAYFQNIAGELGYVALDPIIDHKMPEVSKRANVCRQDALFSHIIMNDLEKKDLVNLAVNYGVEMPYLKRAKESFTKREINGDPTYKDIKYKANLTTKKLYNVSNEMSRENIESLIEQNNNNTNTNSNNTSKVFMFTDVSCEPLLNYYINLHN